MNESNIIRLYNYLKDNYIKLYDSPVRYHYICSTRNFHYFTQHSFDEFKIKAINKSNKNDIVIYRFSNDKELITLLNQVPLIKSVFANLVKQLSYFLYVVQNRIKCSGTNVNDVFYIEARTYFNEYKNQYSDYLNRQENVIRAIPNDQVVSFNNARNIFINDRVERVQLSGQNMLTEERAREIINQTFRERAAELIERQNRIATDPRIEQELRQLRSQIEELSRRFYRMRNPEQR